MDGCLIWTQRDGVGLAGDLRYLGLKHFNWGTTFWGEKWHAPFLNIFRHASTRFLLYSVIYCNKFAGSLSRWTFITLTVHYTTLDYSSQLFLKSNTRMTDSRITANTSTSSSFSTGSSALITNYTQQLYNTRLDSTSLLTRLTSTRPTCLLSRTQLSNYDYYTTASFPFAFPNSTAWDLYLSVTSPFP
jgi:hypothetical protein